jgi:hypothetical protein
MTIDPFRVGLGQMFLGKKQSDDLATTERLKKNTMKYLCNLLLFFILTGCSSHSSKKEISNTQDSVIVTAVLPVDAFPVQFNGRYIIIRAVMNDSTEINLLLDTGAQEPTFDSSFIAQNKDRLGIVTKPAHAIVETPSGLFNITDRITGTIKLKALAVNEEFRGALMIANIKKLNLGADAIFPAYLFFNDKIVMIDLKGQYIRILSQDTLSELKSQYVSFPLKGTQYTYFSISSKIFAEKAPDLPVNITGDLQIDLGAPGFLYLFKSKASVKTAFTPATKSLTIKTLAFNMTDTVYSEALVTDQLQLSDTLGFMKAKITLLNQFINIDPTQIGLLGNEFLRKFTVIIDYRNKQLYLRPNAEYFSPCRNSNLGMRLSKMPGHKSYSVNSLYEGTPISMAGIRLGDEILSINGILTESISEAEMNSIQLSPVGTKLMFRIQRKNVVFDKAITIENIW